MPHLRPCPVAVVGERFDQQRDAAWTVALVDDGLDPLGVGPFAGSFRDRPLDVVLGHRCLPGLLNGQGRPRGAVRVPSPLTRRHRYRTGQLRELLTAPGIDGCLLVLDGVPFGVTGHRRCKCMKLRVGCPAMKRIFKLTLPVVLLALAGCGSSSSSSSSPSSASSSSAPASTSAPPPSGTQVTMKNLAFLPKVVHAKVGQTVGWTNQD